VADVVHARGAPTASPMPRRCLGAAARPPTRACVPWRRGPDLAAARGTRPHGGSVLTTDAFYPAGEDWWKIWARHGVLAAEMETAALYTLAARFGARALSILTVSDHIITGEHASAEDRQTGFGQMAGLALDLAASVA